MIYSVYDVGRHRYDYYDDGQLPESLNATKPRHLTNRALGSTIEQASWPLPANARHVGSGEVAMGRVATRSSPPALGALELPDSPLVKAGLLAFAAVLAYKYVLKPARGR